MPTRVLSLTSPDWISTDDIEGFLTNPSNAYVYYAESPDEPVSDVGHVLPYLKAVNFVIDLPDKLWLRPVSGNNATVTITTR